MKVLEYVGQTKMSGTVNFGPYVLSEGALAIGIRVHKFNWPADASVHAALMYSEDDGKTFLHGGSVGDDGSRPRDAWMRGTLGTLADGAPERWKPGTILKGRVMFSEEVEAAVQVSTE